MGVEKYGISTYGKVYLIDEGITEFSTIRLIYIAANAFMLLGATLIVTQQYLKLRKAIYKPQTRKRRANIGVQGLLTPFFVAFMVNNLIRGSHMIDHITRPVYYYEPKWSYAKIWITECEVPTYANVVIQGIGLLAILKVMDAVTGDSLSKLTTSLRWMIFFIPASAFNIIHYTIEPPSNYGPFPNFNIAGSAISTIPLALLIFLAYKQYQPSPDNNESTASLLQSADDDQKMKPKHSTARRRSRTPVRN